MSKTIKKFFSKYDGKKIDFDGAYGAQCVDLYRQYCKEVFKIPQSPPVRGAADIWNTYLKEHFERIPNTPTGVPKLGDIVIWNEKSGGGYGHVSIFSDGGVNRFRSFDQNWPTGSACHFQGHYYTNVLGWLRPKTSVYNGDVESLQWLKQMYAEVGIDLNRPEGEIRGRVQEVFDGYRQYGELQDKVNKLEKEVAFQAGEAAKHEEELRKTVANRETLAKAVDDLRRAVTSRDSEIDRLNKEVETLKNNLDPETNVLIPIEEYKRLQKKKVIDRFDDKELRKIVLELVKRRLKRVWDKIKSWILPKKEGEKIE